MLDGDIDSTSRETIPSYYHQENQQHYYWHYDSCWNLALANNGADDWATEKSELPYLPISTSTDFFLISISKRSTEYTDLGYRSTSLTFTEG